VRKGLTGSFLVAALVMTAAYWGCGGKSTGSSSDAPPAIGHLGAVPVYPNAIEEVNSDAEFSGQEIAGLPAAPPVGESQVDVSGFDKIETFVYDTEDSAAQVFDWYESNMSGWTEDWSSRDDGSAQHRAVAVWTRDGGKEAAWMKATEDFGKTTLFLWYGS
jgi:hypothetical protein